jgi:hypothetical protein
MSLQFDATVRNAMLDAIEAQIGVSPTMKLRTGAPPADCATADSGVVVATIALPADWMATAASGSKAKLGTWQDASADAAGVAAHFRIYDGGGVCRMQGTVTLTGAGGDMTLDNTNIQPGQNITISSFTINQGNA